MTAGPSIEPARFLHEQLTHASPDLLRDLLSTFIDALMSAEADAICRAEYGARSTERASTSPPSRRCGHCDGFSAQRSGSAQPCRQFELAFAVIRLKQCR